MKLWNEVSPFATAKTMVPRSVYQHVRIKVAFNSVSFQGKGTNQNDTPHNYSLIVHWQFSFIQHLCLRFVQNIYSKWLTHRFQHFSNSAKGLLALLIGMFQQQQWGKFWHSGAHMGFPEHINLVFDWTEHQNYDCTEINTCPTTDVNDNWNLISCHTIISFLCNTQFSILAISNS